jgi:hypothetical protein
MIVRSARCTLLLTLAALGLMPAGCEPHRSWARPQQDDMMSAADDTKPSKVIGSSPDDKDASNFFQSNRRSGAWSSEAREIESHLGAN